MNRRRQCNLHIDSIHDFLIHTTFARYRVLYVDVRLRINTQCDGVTLLRRPNRHAPKAKQRNDTGR